MSLLEQVYKDLRRHEGCRLKPYKDTEGVWTIGYGHTGPNINGNTPRVTQAQADAWLVEDTNEAIALAKQIVSCYRELDNVRKGIMINMAFNLGYRLRGFRKMLSALEAKDYSTAALEMLDSKWARQVKGRANELASRMSSGRISSLHQYRGD